MPQPLQYGYTPDGTLGAVLAGQEDTYTKALREWQNQQAAEKQAADIENTRMGKLAYQAQVEAQRENMLASMAYRKAQEQDLLQKTTEAKEAAAYPAMMVLSDYSQKFLDPSNKLSDQERISYYNQARAMYDDMAARGVLPPSVVAARGDQTTSSSFGGTPKTSGYDPEFMTRFAQNAARSKGITTLQQAETNAQKARDVAVIQGEYSLAKQQLSNEMRMSLQRLKDTMTSAKPPTESQMVAAANNTMMDLERKIKSPGLSQAEVEALQQEYGIINRQLAKYMNDKYGGKVMAMLTPEGDIRYQSSKPVEERPTPQPPAPQVSADDLLKLYSTKK